ncbi:glycerol kinase GlpK [Leptothoe kymatousa]|uniref:Glycerol kinase n=1 Tax=Leptothoe kymatousa TAU-MAC 1615 TaxID=2364775 RepID=A0ABS5XZ32_9CYAN|nr:glycerol kinase GlpK [Leptothoe kymatousa]MBT9310869.1 glycerol kinase GlpK [Leptothoe kymatousa TAU-MAC 1615]
MPQYVMALDLGTTGNRAILFNRAGDIVGQAYKELTQHYPQPGWVEHDAMEIWQDVQWAMKTAIAEAKISASDIAAIGLTVQRETCLLWDKTTGEPLHKAIVWQDRRTADMCATLADKKADIYERSGLFLDAYFSGTKLRWLLNKTQPANLDNVLAGTIDTWALWNLTGGNVHATDHSNASRTLLMNLANQQWDDTLLNTFGIPRSLLADIKPSQGIFGYTDPSILGAEIPIAAILGDQQAALFAHGCDRPGLLKCTYGTGAFLVAHSGKEIVRSNNQLLSTIGWTTATDGGYDLGYGLEGSMFTAGACIQWLRDGLQIIDSAADSEPLALSVEDNGGVYFVPALSGLGAPHWDMGARGAFLGITRGATKAHMVRAVLEAIANQVREVVTAINDDSGTPITTLKVDGGACHNNFLMQYQADVLGIPVERPAVLDATAQGSAFAAGLAVGYWDDYTALVSSRKIDKTFEPGAGKAAAQENFATWERAVERAKGWIG